MHQFLHKWLAVYVLLPQTLFFSFFVANSFTPNSLAQLTLEYLPKESLLLKSWPTQSLESPPLGYLIYSLLSLSLWSLSLKSLFLLSLCLQILSLRSFCLQSIHSFIVSKPLTPESLAHLYLKSLPAYTGRISTTERKKDISGLKGI